jgi:hypothetical protein
VVLLALLLQMLAWERLLTWEHTVWRLWLRGVTSQTQHLSAQARPLVLASISVCLAAAAVAAAGAVDLHGAPDTMFGASRGNMQI